jgi:predicted MFS family arabinose efflux permease
MRFLTRANRDLRVIYAAGLLRSTGVGLTGVLLGVYLSRAGFSATQIGIVITAGLAASALGTLAVSLCADRLGRGRTLIGVSLLSALGGVGFVLTGRFSGFLLLSSIGMVNGMGTDRGPAFSLDQALIPQTVSVDLRTTALSWHSLIMDIGHALGALGAGLPLLFQRWLPLELLICYRFTFGIYAAINALTAATYLLLSPAVEVRGERTAAALKGRLSPQSRSVIAKLAALSGIDSLGGGFLTDALLAYWFFHRFGIRESSLGLLFSAGNMLNSGSYLLAARLARRIGLLNTMVFTHIPSSLLLMAVPFSPSPGWAVGFYLAWESLVEMDVPTRQSYLMAVVRPVERTLATGVTNFARSVSRSLTPSVAGYVMQHVALATPLFLGGSIKIAYDIMLYSAFRRLKPPEGETASASTEGTSVSTG